MSQLDLQAYLNTYTELTNAIQDLSEKELVWKPAPNKWSITEVLTHLADHNLVVSVRIRNILAAGDGPFLTFNQDGWVSGQLANKEKAKHVLQFFQALLIYNHSLLSRLADEDLSKSTINAKGDKVNIYDIVSSFTNHVHHHISQIKRIQQAYAQAAIN